MFTGLRSIIYPSKNLQEDSQFWEKVTGVKPYFNEPFYIGFDIGGFELGLDPNAAAEGLQYPIAYWHVENVRDASSHIISSGATKHTEPKDVGGGMIMATFKDKSENIFGIIQHPKTT